MSVRVQAVFDVDGKLLATSYERCLRKRVREGNGVEKKFGIYGNNLFSPYFLIYVKTLKSLVQSSKPEPMPGGAPQVSAEEACVDVKADYPILRQFTTTSSVPFSFPQTHREILDFRFWSLNINWIDDDDDEFEIRPVPHSLSSFSHSLFFQIFGIPWDALAMRLDKRGNPECRRHREAIISFDECVSFRFLFSCSWCSLSIDLFSLYVQRALRPHLVSVLKSFHVASDCCGIISSYVSEHFQCI